MSEQAQLVPRDEIVAVFGGLMAASPACMTSLIGIMAARHGVDAEALRPQVMEVLASLPPWED